MTSINAILLIDTLATCIMGIAGSSQYPPFEKSKGFAKGPTTPPVGPFVFFWLLA
jgi:hypothetical protein